MLKKFFVIFIFLFLVSCGNNNISEKETTEEKNGSEIIINSELEKTKETLKNGLEINALTANIMNNICENLEGKVDYILEREEKIPGKIEVVSFVEDYIKEDKKDDYNDFVSLKNGKINGVYKKFENAENLQKVFDEFKNKEDFFFYLSNYMIFLDKDKYFAYVEKYLNLLGNIKEEVKETPFIGIILAEYKQNKSCSEFVKNKFLFK